MVLIAADLPADARAVHAGVLRVVPHRDRRDVQELWTAFGFTLARYLGEFGL